MSSMLEEAIIDATALKEAAQKSAEEKIIEHFSKDIKEAVDLILEQDVMMDPLAMGVPGLGTTMAPTQPYTPGAQAPGAPPVGWADFGPGLIDIEAEGPDTHEGESIIKQAPYAATTSDKDVVSIDLTKLEEALQVSLSAGELESSAIEEDYDIEGEREYIFSPGDDLMEVAEENDDEYQSLEEMVRAALTGDSSDLLGEDGAVYQREGKLKPCKGDCANSPGDLCPEGQECKERTMKKDGKIVKKRCCVDKPAPQETDPGGFDMSESISEASIAEAIRDILAEEMDDLQESGAKPCPKGKEWVEIEGHDAGGECQVKKVVSLKRGTHTRTGLTKKEIERVVNPPPPTKEHKQLNDKLKFLEQKLNKYQEVFPQLKQQLEESSLQNARLHYQNRILNSASLNERQKDRLVETISKANTVEEAKIIYETLQSAVGASAPKRQPKSLNEVVTKRSSAFMPRKEEKRVDTLAARMKALAGITDK